MTSYPWLRYKTDGTFVIILVQNGQKGQQILRVWYTQNYEKCISDKRWDKIDLFALQFS